MRFNTSSGVGIASAVIAPPAIGKRLKNLPELRKVGFKANRRLLDTQRISHDCAIGEDAFNRVTQPIEAKGHAHRHSVSPTQLCWRCCLCWLLFVSCLVDS